MEYDEFKVLLARGHVADAEEGKTRRRHAVVLYAYLTLAGLAVATYLYFAL